MKAFEIVIIPDPTLIQVAQGAVEQYAAGFFDDKKDIKRISLALEEAISNVLTFSMSETLKELRISCEARDGQFIVEVHDEGLPGDFGDTLKGDELIGVQLMGKVLDIFKVENRGTGGRVQKMVKYYSRSNELVAQPIQQDETPVENAVITVRGSEEKDMLEICRRLYGEYGLTYLHDDIYYPEKFYAEVKSDAIHSIVAVDENGNIAGHHASFEWEDVPGIWESGMAVVNPRYRGYGIFGKMMDVTRDYVINQRKARVFISCAITLHTATQRLRLKLGDSPCGFLLNTAADDVGRMNTFESKQERTSLALAASILDKTPKTLHVHEDLVHILQPFYEAQQTERTYITDRLEPDEEETIASTFSNARTRSGRIVLKNVGKDYEKAIQTEQFSLKKQNVEQIELFLPMEATGSVTAYRLAKRLGFFFMGIIPCSDYGDMMVMGKMLVHLVDYESIVTMEPFTTFKEEVRKLDPDQKGKQ